MAQNIANANTPGYVAKEVAPFKAVYDQTQLELVSTSPGHMALDPLSADDATKDTSPWEVVPSGNSVSMEREMLKANEVSREYSMNTAIVKAFAQMYTVSVKGL